MKKYLLSLLLIAGFAIGFIASDDPGVTEDKGGGVTPVSPSEFKGIVELVDKFGDWDAAYLTPYGYFVFSKEIKSDAEGNFSSISFLSTNGAELASLIITKDKNLPTQLVVNEKGTISFSFPNDSIVELIFDDKKTVSFLGSYKCRQSELPSFVDLDKTDVFRAALANASALIKANTSGEAINPVVQDITNHFATMFGNIGKSAYEKNDEEVAKIPLGTSGNYEFAEKIRKWYLVEITARVYNTLSLWTGKATFKVGGSSCTLSGTIYCPSDVYNKLGTYGIVCDTEAEKLLVGEGGAEYQGKGSQPYGALSFDVDFRGLKPNTKYYYRAYYQFNDTNHGSLVPRFGLSTDQVIYDPMIKSFTTGDNLLSVDVVMLIDITGSMSGIINTVKNNAMSFYDSFKSKCDAQKIGLTGLNTQVIAFQDKNFDGDRWFIPSPTYKMPEQREAFNTFVGKLYADGGGDTPESGLEALDAAFSKTDWGTDDGYHRQVIILWTDAPYLIGKSFTDLTVEDLEKKWNSMPSGRRMILFAPNESWNGNGGRWDVFDSWKNVIHETNLYSGFSDFDYILESIIGELTSKSRGESYDKSGAIQIVSRPNK